MSLSDEAVEMTQFMIKFVAFLGGGWIIARLHQEVQQEHSCSERDRRELQCFSNTHQLTARILL